MTSSHRCRGEVAPAGGKSAGNETNDRHNSELHGNSSNLITDLMGRKFSLTVKTPVIKFIILGCCFKYTLYTVYFRLIGAI